MNLVIEYILSLLKDNVKDKNTIIWLENKVNFYLEKEQELSQLENSFYINFSMASRYFSNEPLKIDFSNLNDLIQLVEQLEETNKIAKLNKSNKVNLSSQDLSRLLLIYSMITKRNKKNELHINKLSQLRIWLKKCFQTADIKESITIGRILYLLPTAEKYNDLAKWILRTNILTVFESVSSNNLFPSVYFDEDSWNQMLLKAIFIEANLSQIIGVEQRANEKLKTMLFDFAMERKKANREIHPLLWQSTISYLNEDDIKWLSSLYLTQTQNEALGIALTLHLVNLKNKEKTLKIKKLLEKRSQIYSKIINQEFTWKQI